MITLLIIGINWCLRWYLTDDVFSDVFSNDINSTADDCLDINCVHNYLNINRWLTFCPIARHLLEFFESDVSIKWLIGLWFAVISYHLFDIFVFNRQKNVILLIVVFVCRLTQLSVNSIAFFRSINCFPFISQLNYTWIASKVCLSLWLSFALQMYCIWYPFDLQRVRQITKTTTNSSLSHPIVPDVCQYIEQTWYILHEHDQLSKLPPKHTRVDRVNLKFIKMT